MPPLRPLFRFETYPAADIRATSGANEGDAIGLGDAALPGDTYRLRRGAQALKLAICDAQDGAQVVADGSEIGTPGERLRIAACHTLMGRQGELVDALILVQEAAEGPTLLVLALSPMQVGVDYDLIGSEVEGAPDRFAEITSVSFLAGTHLTRADGRQIPVEDLSPGDTLLTRNNGPQPIRWIGSQTRRAVGAAAPVRIAKGTLNTASDLRLSPQHRLFIWQRHDALGTGRAEVLVKAELLVNGTTVTREEGGHVDSYQLVFDRHEIIYAEGIAVESLLVTAQTRDQVPADLSLEAVTQGQERRSTLEVDERALGTQEDAAARLTRASRGQSD